MRTLAQTGLVGALLLLGAIGCAMWGALRAARQPDRLAGAVAIAATMSFVYWLVHGSFDWFWEFAGLGAPAWAAIGLACALLPRGEPRADPRAPRRLPTHVVVVGAFALVAALSLAAPWIAETQTRRAAHSWPSDLRRAEDRLNQAATMNPLSDRPYLVAGTIALRRGDLAGAEEDFRLALKRNRRSGYATLEMGAIAATLGQRARAIGLLERAVALNPRDRLAHDTLRRARQDRPIDVESLNRRIRERAAKIR
jgi:tetratricopeptide (TPR) repeat protein